jgi:hypothetical protein
VRPEHDGVLTLGHEGEDLVKDRRKRQRFQHRELSYRERGID